MIVMGGVFLQEEQVLLLDKTSPNNLITPMISNLWLEPINSSWMDSIGVMKKLWSQFSQLLIIVTDVVTKQEY